MANTSEPLYIVNRSGNRPSHEGAPQVMDRGIVLCRRAGFKKILLRGDTDFSLTRNFDRWDDDGVCFVFGVDASKPMVSRAETQPETLYELLERRVERELKTQPRTRPENVKERIVKERAFKNLRLNSEQVVEFEYQPTKCTRPYRVIALRKNITVEQGDLALFDEIRYFFYITNDRTMSPAEVVFEANQRCNQENLIEQLKNGARALHAGLNTLNANWAYMVAASLAWSLKAWAALLLPPVAEVADAPPPAAATCPAHGLQDLHQRLHQDTHADRPDQSSDHLSTADLRADHGSTCSSGCSTVSACLPESPAAVTVMSRQWGLDGRQTFERAGGALDHATTWQTTDEGRAADDRALAIRRQSKAFLLGNALV